MLRLSYHTATSRAKASPVFAQAHDALPALGATHLGDLRALVVGLAVTGDGRDAPAIAALMTAHCASLSSVMSPDKHLRPRNVLARE